MILESPKKYHYARKCYLCDDFDTSNKWLTIRLLFLYFGILKTLQSLLENEKTNYFYFFILTDVLLLDEKWFFGEFELTSKWRWNIFGLKISFQSFRTFLWALRTCLRYLGSPLNVTLYVSKQIMNAQHIHEILCPEKRKKLRFWKMKLCETIFLTT